MPLIATFQPPRRNGLAVMALAKHVAETAGAEALLKASKPLVPRDTGELVESGHVEHDAGGAMVVYDVTSPDGYPYGVRVHEDMAMHHPNGGEPKYLERPMHTAGAAIIAAMATVARRLM